MTDHKKKNTFQLKESISNYILEEKIKNYENALIAMYELNYDLLSNAIDKGFVLDAFFENKSGTIIYGEPDLKVMAPIIHLANKGWIDGWKLLAKRFPNELKYQKEKEFPLFWETALHNAQQPILLSLTSLGVDPLYRDYKNRSSVHLLFETLRFEKIIKPTTEQIIYSLKWLTGKGLDPYEVYPGDYEYRDIYKNGHNLWSYALYQESWDIALKLMPLKWEDVIKTPRWEEAIIYLKNIYKQQPDNEKIIKIIRLWEERFLLNSIIHNNKDIISKENLVKILKTNKKDKMTTDIIWKHFLKLLEDRDYWFFINQKPEENREIYELLLETHYDYRADWMIDFKNSRNIEILLLAIELKNINLKEDDLIKKIILPFIDYPPANEDINSFDNLNISSKIKEKLN